VTNRTGFPPVEGLTEALGAVVRTPRCGEPLASAARDPYRRVKTPPMADALEWHCRSMLDALPVPVYTIDAKGRLTYFNRAAIAFSGRKPRLGLDEWCVTWRLYRPDGSFLPHELCPAAVALKERRPVRGIDAIAERPDGMRQRFLPFPTPLRDVFGRVTGAVNMLVDISSGGPDGGPGLDKGALPANLVEDILYRACNDAPNAESRAKMTRLAQRIGSITAAQDLLDREDEAPDYDACALTAAVGVTARHWLASPISLQTPVRPCRLPRQTALPLALILAELIAKAVPGNGEEKTMVEVDLQEQADTFELSVARRDLPRLQSGEPLSGLGLLMGLAEQIGAGLDVDPQGQRWIMQLRRSLVEA
jgi:two-component sensor histidine kinase